MFIIFPVNGCDFNKSFVSENADVSISDVSCWFQTQLPSKTVQKVVRRKSFADESFETKVANFRNLLIKVKEIIDGDYIHVVIGLNFNNKLRFDILTQPFQIRTVITLSWRKQLQRSNVLS